MEEAKSWLFENVNKISFVVVVQSLSHVWLCDSMNCSMTGFPVLYCFPSLLKLISIESVMIYNHLILWCPPLLLASIFPSIRVFSNELAFHIRWAMYWSFSFNISTPNEYSRWISLGLAGLISLLSKGLSRVFSTTTFQKHQFFGAQLSLWFSSHIHTWLLEKP